MEIDKLPVFKAVISEDETQGVTQGVTAINLVEESPLGKENNFIIIKEDGNN